MKYYHCSRLHHKVGDVIEPTNYGEQFVWVSTSKTPHYTLYQFGERGIQFEQYRLYEVRPINPKTKIVKGCWDDIKIKGAVEIVASLGESSRNRKGSIVFVNKKTGKLDSLVKKVGG
jgi:hypothetical protein